MTREEGRKRRFRRLRAASDAGLPALTITLARAFLRRYPDFGPAWSTLGKALTEMALFDEAEEAMTRAIAFCPDERVDIPLAQMGHLFKFRGDHARAEEWYRKVIDASPDDASGFIYLGSVLALQGRLAEAEMTHRAATQCQEGCIDEAYLNLGFVLRAQDRLVEASECFAHALALDPEYRAAKKALRDVRLALKIRPLNS